LPKLLRPEYYGDVLDAITQAHKATMDLVSDEHAYTVPTTLQHEDTFCYLIYTHPFPPTDKRARQFATRMRALLAQELPQATPLFVSGEGVPDDQVGGSFTMQVAALFPCAEMPAAYQLPAPPTQLPSPPSEREAL